MPSSNIPAHHEMYADVLTVLSQAPRPFTKGEVVEPLALRYQLTDAELTEMYDSGNGPVFADRVQWALSYLNMADFMDKPKRGFYSLSDEGLSFVGKENEIVKATVDQRFQARNVLKAGTPSTDVSASAPIQTITVKASDNPQEELNNAFARLQDFIYQELLRTIQSKTPPEFERLVVMLLKAMGYGGTVANSGTVTQYGRDGGIDGIIKEDVLGFGRIFIQAKRYADGQTIGRPAIQAFLGALTGVGASKGILITTSRFSQDAIDFVAKLASGTNLVLMDGNELAKYLYQYGVGMQVRKTFVVKDLDSDFWDDMQDIG